MARTISRIKPKFRDKVNVQTLKVYAYNLATESMFTNRLLRDCKILTKEVKFRMKNIFNYLQ